MMANPFIDGDLLDADGKFKGDDAIASVYLAFEDLSKAKTIGQQGSAFQALSNAVSDLISWHPDWDWEHGYLKGVEEE